MLKLGTRIWLVALLTMALAPVLLAQDQQPGRRGRGRGMRSPLELPAAITLDDAQKSKLEELKTKYADKLKAATDKAKLTEEQTTAQRDAFRKARQEGKQGDELQKAVQSAVSLTDDQKKGREELASLTRDIREAINGFLTDEQKTKLRELRQQRGRRGQGGNRPASGSA